MAEDNEFGFKEADANKSEVKRIIAEVDKESITFDNFEDVKIKVDGQISIIKTQQENAFKTYKYITEEYANFINNEVMKRYKDNPVVPRKLYELLLEGNKALKEYITWSMLKEELLRTYAEKLNRLIKEARGMKIMGQTLIEIKSYVQDNFKFQKEVVEAKVNHIETKMMSLFEQINRNNLILNKENTRMIIDGKKEDTEMMIKMLSMMTESLQIEQGKAKQIIDNYEKERKTNQDSFTKKIKDKEESLKDAVLEIPELPANSLLPTKEAKVTAKNNDLEFKQDDDDEMVDFAEFK